MTKIYCNAELEIDDVILRCKFRGEDGCCTKDETKVRDEENAYAVCDDVDWIEIEEKVLSLRCDTCGTISPSADILHEIYGTGRNKAFGQCPQCHGIGEFQIVKKEDKE